eukprot:PhF_6_TR4544/c2_g1_i1/m.6405
MRNVPLVSGHLCMQALNNSERGVSLKHPMSLRSEWSCWNATYQVKRNLKSITHSKQQGRGGFLLKSSRWLEITKRRSVSSWTWCGMTHSNDHHCARSKNPSNDLRKNTLRHNHFPPHHHHHPNGLFSPYITMSSLMPHRGPHCHHRKISHHHLCRVV